MIHWHALILDRVTFSRRLMCALLFSLGCSVSSMAAAEVLNDIEVSTDQGVVEYRLQFSVPIQYIKHFPQDQGELIKLYLQALRLDDADRVDRMVYKRTPILADSPPFNLIYSTTRGCFAVLDPICLDIQFNQPVRFKIRQGEDGRSIILIVLPDTTNRNPASKKH